MDQVEKGRTFHFLSRSETDGGSEGNFCGEEKNSIVGVVGARRQAAHARGGRRGGGDFRPSDGQIQNEDEEERRERGDETRRTDGPTDRAGAASKTAAERQSLSQAG